MDAGILVAGGEILFNFETKGFVLKGEALFDVSAHE